MSRSKQTDMWAPRFRGKPSQVFDLPSSDASYCLRIDDGQMLFIMWDHDESGARQFRIRMLGFDGKGKPVYKQYRKKKRTTAFMGEVAVLGPGNSELWASMGYEDPDDVDEEGNVTNKPREVIITPVQDH